MKCFAQSRGNQLIPSEQARRGSSKEELLHDEAVRVAGRPKSVGVFTVLKFRKEEIYINPEKNTAQQDV